MTGTTSSEDGIADVSRFDSHAHLRTQGGMPVLRRDHDYITVWGFWNGLDEFLAERDGEFCTGINASNACQRGLITGSEYAELLEDARQRLATAGIEDLALRGKHILLTLNPRGELVRSAHGPLEIRFCNFEAMRKLPA
jgi:hypothetical protein